MTGLSTRAALRLTLTLAVLALWAPPASAQTLSLTVGLPVTLSPFAPGRTATGTGSLTVAAAASSWRLQVHDSGLGAGRLRAASTGCTGSSPQLDNPLTVTVTGAANVASAGVRTIGPTPTTVASGPSSILTAADLTASYAVAIPATQAMLTGCQYRITVTYTLQ